MIYKNVEKLTKNYRTTIKGFRETNSTSLLPREMRELPGDLIETRELNGIMFTGTGGTRNVLHRSICDSIEKVFKP